jgi:RHS repeat-associated protein
MSKTVNGTTTKGVWDLAEGLPTIVQDGSTKEITGPGALPIEQVASDGTVLYYLQDQLGSTRGLTDSSGTLVGTFSYDAYGNLTSSTGTATTPFGYTGQYTDSESGLQYLRARYYDPQTAQFVSVDPLVSLTQDPYAYAADDSMNLADPQGLIGGGVCFSASGNLTLPFLPGGPQVTASKCLVAAIGPSGVSVGVVRTAGVSVSRGSPGGSFGPGVIFTPDASSVSELGGPFVYGGGSADVADLTGSFDTSVGASKCGTVSTYQFGLGMGMEGYEVHSGITQTKVSQSPGDILQTALDFFVNHTVSP